MCREREVFYIPIIRSQSFIEPVPQAVPFTSASSCQGEGGKGPLGESGRLEGLKLGIFFPPGHLGSGEIVSSEGRPSKEDKIIWAYFPWLLFPAPCQKHREIFCDPHDV